MTRTLLRPTRRLAFAVTLMALPLATGCFGMGGRIGHTYLRGTVSDPSGRPRAEQKLQFIRPLEHNYAEIIEELNDYRLFPFGEELIKASTDDEGYYQTNVGGSIYRGVCLLPFLCVPVHPPAPTVVLRDPDFPDELYVIRTRNGDVTVLNREGEAIPMTQSRLAGVTIRKEHGRWFHGPRKTIAFIDIRLKPGS